MKYWIINNTNFGYKNNSSEWFNTMLDYFDNYFIPFIQKNSKPSDKLVHLGNIFVSYESVKISQLLTIKELFVKLNNILPVIILDGYNEKSGISKLLDVKVVDNVSDIDGVKFISNKNPLEYINNDSIVFTNNRIDTQLLKRYDTLFFCGYHNEHKEDENIINVGCPYSLEKGMDGGFYVLDVETRKYKYVKNTYSPSYQVITITDISQIDEIDSEFVNKNNVSVVVDRSLVDDKKIKIDVLLSKYNFKSVSYTNEVVEEVADGTSMNMEDLIREKISSPDLLNEFENILRIYKEKYN